MTVKKIEKEIEIAFLDFEVQLEKFSKTLTFLAKNDLQSELHKLRLLESDQKRIDNLKLEIHQKKSFTDIAIDGINHLESEVKRLENKFLLDHKKLFFGNSFVRSMLGFEAHTLAEIELKSKELFQRSLGIQRKIHGLLDFVENDFKGKVNLEKNRLYKKSIFLAETNLVFFGDMIYLTNLKFNTSQELEEYLAEKNRILAKMDLETAPAPTSLREVGKTLYAHLLADFERSNAIDNVESYEEAEED